MIEFMENDERQGRIESVWSLINNYNEALSEKANDELFCGRLPENDRSRFS